MTEAPGRQGVKRKSMKTVPDMPASRAQGQTLLGADGNWYVSRKNRATGRWRWVAVDGPKEPPVPKEPWVRAKKEESREDREKTMRARKEVHAEAMKQSKRVEAKEEAKEERPKSTKKASVRRDTGGIDEERYRRWRLSGYPTELDQLPTMTKQLHDRLAKEGIKRLGALAAEVILAKRDFDIFAEKMRKLGLDDDSIELIFDKFAGDIGMLDKPAASLKPEDVEVDLFDALLRDPAFSKSFTLMPRGHDHFKRAIATGGMSVVFGGERKVDGLPIVAKVEFGSTKALARELTLFEKMDKSAKHINFPLDAFVLLRHRTGLDFDATAVVSPYLRGCGLLAEKSADLDVSDCLEQCAEALEEVHRSGIIHCDVKPDNFCVEDTVFIIDFGLARFVSGEKHRAESFFGTLLFAPLAAHLRQPQGFRDDLEALAYTFYELLTDKPLPWANVKGTEKQQEKARIEGKRNPPIEIRAFIKQCRALKQDEMPPDYREFVRQLM